MTSDLQWNAQEDAQREARRAAEVAPQEKVWAEQRAIRRRNIPVWEAYIANAEQALTAAEAAQTDREREQGDAWARYLRAYHAQTGGSTPRNALGELVLLTPMKDMHPEARAALPAVPEWERYEKAKQAAVDAGIEVRRIQNALTELRAELTLCRQA